MLKRPILIITLSYIIGILGGLYLKKNIVPFLSIFVGLVIVVYAYLYYLNKHKIQLNKVNKNSIINHIVNICTTYKLLIIISVIVLILSSARITYLQNKYEKIYLQDGLEINFIGKIISIQKSSNYYDNYIVEIQKSSNNIAVSNNTRILLKLKRQKEQAYSNNSEINTKEQKNSEYNKQKDINIDQNKLQYGDLVSGKIILEKPEVQRNFKGYDYSKYLKTKSVSMIGKANYGEIKIVKKDTCFVVNMWINTLRQCLSNNLKQLISEENYNIANAFFLGYSNTIDNNQKEVFSNASLSHILAISGMHVSFFISIISVCLKLFDKRKGKYLLILFLIFFSQLTGASPSVLRAVIMSVLAISAKLVYRKSDSLNNISIAGLAILLINPYDIFNMGFQLSFLGTIGIVLFNFRIAQILKNTFKATHYIHLKVKSKILILFLKKILSVLSVTLSANILILPIIAYYYNTLSLTFIISNLIVTPILILLSLTGYLTLITSLFSMKIASILSIFLNIMLNTFSQIALFCSNINIIKLKIITPSLFIIIIYYIFVFYLFYYHKKKYNLLFIKIISIICIFTIIINILQYYNNPFKMFFIDVGQGDSTLIMTSTNKTILIDGGGNEDSEYDVGKNVLLPYLYDRGVNKIDFMIFSHFDSDHCKGLFTVMENMTVKYAIVSSQGKQSDNYNYFKELANKRKIKIIYVKAGDTIKVDKYTNIQVLWPDKTLISENVLNNNSIVCKVNYKDTSILFTGDIEEIAEKEIVNKYGSLLKSDILKIAHHGSKTSSSEEMLNCIKPAIAVIGVGKNNKFGHPNSNVLDRLNKMNTKIYRTDKNGEIILKLYKSQIFVNTTVKGKGD